MDILDLMKQRRSCKAYKSEMVPDELINKVVEAGLCAPTGRNMQASEIIVITNNDVRDKLAEINASIMGAKMDPFYGAPVVLMVVARKEAHTAIYDGSTTIENMLLEAFNLGLGSCWIHRAKEELEMTECKELLEASNLDLDNYIGVGHVILGYPKNDNFPPKSEKPNRVSYIR